MNVIKIDSTISSQSKKRVAAYCRVSTENEDQLESLKIQREYYERLLMNNPNYIFAGIYYDEGISGTSMRKRTSLIKLLNDCENGMIDKIVTKSISRFARNTSDCLTIIRRLAKLNIEVYFEKENINTSDMDSELLLSLLAGIAQSESESMSQNMKWGIQRKFKSGDYIISLAPYGYRKNGKQLEIDEEEAEIIKFIFDEYLKGIGMGTIAKKLKVRGVKTRKDNEWTSGTIRTILSNEKYIGNTIFQKTYTDSSFKRHRNNGEENKYFLENTHEAIITKETFESVQELIAKKSQGIKRSNIKDKNYPLSGKIICSKCGSKCTRKTCRTGKAHYAGYVCSTHLIDKEKCGMTLIKESYIKEAFITMMNKMTSAKKEMLYPLKKQKTTLDENSIIREIEIIDEKIDENINEKNALLSLLKKNYIELEQYDTKNKELIVISENLNQRKLKLENILINKDNSEEALQEFIEYMSKREISEEFSEEEFRNFVEEIIVLGKQKIKFVLKCGLSLMERW